MSLQGKTTMSDDFKLGGEDEIVTFNRLESIETNYMEKNHYPLYPV